MPRNLRTHEREKKGKARREFALARLELREPSSPRAAAAGPVSHAIKERDPAIDAAVEAFLNKRKENP